MKKLILLAPIFTAIFCSGCSTIRAITYIPPKDSPRFIRTMNWDSVGKPGYIPTYSIGVPVGGP